MSQILDGQINLKDRMTPILDKINKKLKEMSNMIPSMVNNVDKTLDKMKNKFSKYETDMAVHQNKLLHNMKQNQRNFINYLHAAPKEIEKANAKMTAKARSFAMHQQNITMGLAAAAAPGAYLGYKTAKNYGSFDQQMADLRARTIDEGGRYERDYKRQAIKLGMTSKYSATDVGMAQNVLAKAGFSGQQLMTMTPSAINLASANDMKIEEAAAAMIAAKNVFGLRNNLTDLTKVVDMLSYTANKTNSDVKDLIVAMNYAGSTAHGFGMTIEEHLFMSGKLRDFGLSASTAGTSANQLIERISSNEDVQNLLKKVGAPVFSKDKNGVLQRNNIFDIIGNIKNAYDKMNVQEQGVFVKQVAETRGSRALRKFLGIDPAELDKARKEYANYEKIKGYAAKMEQERLKSYFGQIEKLKSAAESLSISIGETITKFGLFEWLLRAAQKFESFTDLFQEYSDALEDSNGDMKKAAELMGDKVWSESLQFIIGFNQGLREVVIIAKEVYDNVLDFFGVFSEGGGAKDLGNFTAKFIAFSATLGPLGIAMFFLKNISMGLYSSIGLLTSGFKQMAGSLSFLFELISGRNIDNKIETAENISQALSTSSGAKRKIPGAKVEDLVASLGLSQTTGDISNMQGSTKAKNLQFYDVNNVTGMPKLNTKKKKINQAIGEFLLNEAAIGGMSGTGSNIIGKSTATGSDSINGIVGSIIGATTGATSGFTGATSASTQNGKFISNSIKDLSNMGAAINDLENSQVMTSMPKNVGKLTQSLEASALLATSAHGNNIWSKLGTVHDAESTSSALGAMNAGMAYRQFSGSSGIGGDDINSPAKKRGIKGFLGDTFRKGGGLLGAVADNYLGAMTFGNQKAFNAVKSGGRGAVSKLGAITGAVGSNLKLAGMVGLEALLPDVNFGGDVYEKDADGKSKKVSSGKANRLGQLKQLPKAAGAKGLDFIKTGLGSIIGLLGSFGSIAMSVITTVLSPFALILGSITVIAIALFSMLKKDGESWGTMFGRLLKNITETALFLWQEVLVPFGQGIREAFLPTIKMIQDAFTKMGERLAPIFSRIAAMFSDGNPNSLSEKMKKFGEIVGWVFNKALLPVINMVTTAVEILAGLFGDILEMFSSLVNGEWTNLGRTIFRMFARIISGIFQLLTTAIGSILQTIGLGKAGTNLVEWGRENLDAEKWTNSLFGMNAVDIAANERAGRLNKSYEVKKNKSAFDVQGDSVSKKNPWEELVSEIRADEANQSVMREEERENGRMLREIAANTKSTAKNTGDPCDTNLDGKKISENQAKHNAINRLQGNGRVVLRTSKTQGRVQ